MQHLLFNSDNYQLSPQVIQAAFIALVVFSLGLYTSYKERFSQVGQRYFLFAFSLFIALFFTIFVRATNHEIVAQIWDRISHIGLAIIPAAAFHFSCEVMLLTRKRYREIIIFWAISAGLVLTLLSSEYFLNGVNLYAWGFESNYGPVGYFFAVYLLVVVVSSLYLYWTNYKNSEKNSVIYLRAKGLLVANGIGALAIVDLAPAFGIEIYPFGFVFILSMFALISMVTWRYHLADITAQIAADGILKIMHDPLFVLDEELNVRFSNDAAERLEENNDEPIQEFIKSQLRSFFPNNNDICEIKDEEIYTKNDNEQDKTYSLTLSIVEKEEFNQTYYVVVLRDITVRQKRFEDNQRLKQFLENRVAERTRQLTEQLKKQQIIEENLLDAKMIAETANDMKSEFLANITHELRTPMHAILGFSKLGLKSLQKNHHDGLSRYFESIHESGDRLLFLINDLLDLSKLESGKIAVQWSNHYIIEIINKCFLQQDEDLKKKKIDWHLENSDDIEIMHCDFNLLCQVISNLLSNAIRFSPETGIIQVKLKNITYSVINKAGDTIDVSAVEFRIVDQGAGIPDSELDSVFNKFTQSSKTKHGAGGTGLGLSICKEIITLHHGKLWAENRSQGQGAVFIFQIPIDQAIVDQALKSA